jgi:hypothetical protein
MERKENWNGMGWWEGTQKSLIYIHSDGVLYHIVFMIPTYLGRVWAIID